MTMTISQPPPTPRGKYRGRYTVLAVDYDGTLASHGRRRRGRQVPEELKKTGRKLVLVTGREVEDVSHFQADRSLRSHRRRERRGGVLAADRRLEVLGEPPPQDFVDALRQRGITPLSVGHVIVATWQPNSESCST